MESSEGDRKYLSESRAFKMIALTSGKFDPCHVGHICNILRIASKCEKLKVIVLDYPERRFSINYTMKVFEEFFSHVEFEIEFIVNTTHFAEVTMKELQGYGCDRYFGGNHKVLRHIEKLGFPIEYIERSYDYSARDIKLPD